MVCLLNNNNIKVNISVFVPSTLITLKEKLNLVKYTCRHFTNINHVKIMYYFSRDKHQTSNFSKASYIINHCDSLFFVFNRFLHSSKVLNSHFFYTALARISIKFSMFNYCKYVTHTESTVVT